MKHQIFWILIVFLTIESSNAAIAISATQGMTPNGDFFPELTVSEQAWLDKYPVPRIGVWINAPPYAFLDEKGSPTGIFIDYIIEIEKMLKKDVKIVPVKNFSTAWEKAMKKELDMLVAVTPSEKHKKHMNLSQTYHTVPIVLVTDDKFPFVSSIRAFNGKKVVVNKGHVTGQWIQKDYPEVQLMPVENYEIGLRLVSEGRADAYIGAMAPFTWEIQKHRITNLKIAAKSPYQYNLSIAVRKDWPELIPIINKALVLIKKHRSDAIYDKWISVRYEKGVDWIKVGKIIGTIITLSTIFCVIVLFWNRKLSQEIMARKKAQHELIKSEQFLNDTGKVAKVGGWELDAKTLNINWTNEISRILDIPINQIPPLEQLMDLFHTDDRSKLETAIQKALTCGEPYDLTIRVLKRNGNVLWTRSVCRPVVMNGNTVKLQGTFQDVTELKKAQENLEIANQKLHKIAMQDGLTKIPNRRCFDTTLTKEWYRMMRDKKPLSLILFDIDHFKLYNDNYGHQAGDSCLQMIADIMKGFFNRPGDLLARYGGEEFAAILPDTPIEGAKTIAEKVRSHILDAKIPHDASPTLNSVTISSGITSTIPTESNNAMVLLEIADKALYEGKKQGRNIVVTKDFLN